MKIITRTMLAGLAASLALAGPAFAQLNELQSGEIPRTDAQRIEAKARVDRAKAEGVVGEQWDGYLGLVHGNAEEDVRAAVQVINWGRSLVYGQAAERNKVAVTVAGIAAFKAFIEARIPPGEVYQNDQGVWVKKLAPGAKGPKK